jgi:hypothetical protein
LHVGRANKNDTQTVDLNQLGGQSVFQISVLQKAPRLSWSSRISEFNKLKSRGDWSSYEDRICMACDGAGQLDCRNCVRGMVRKTESVVMSPSGAGGAPNTMRRTIFENCPVCRGSGNISCAQCENGIDKSLR